MFTTQKPAPLGDPCVRHNHGYEGGSIGQLRLEGMFASKCPGGFVELFSLGFRTRDSKSP